MSDYPEPKLAKQFYSRDGLYTAAEIIEMSLRIAAGYPSLPPDGWVEDYEGPVCGDVSYE